MTTEEREHQEFSGEEKVYPNPGVKLTTHIFILVGCVIAIILLVLLRIYAVQIAEALYDVALRSTVDSFRLFGLAFTIIFSAFFAVYLTLILGGFFVKEIALSKEGVVFRRKRNPVVIQKVTDVKETSRGRILKLTGLSPEGKTLKKRVKWSDVGRKRWGEFKKDLERIKSGN